jgi:hypothetical protein
MKDKIVKKSTLSWADTCVMSGKVKIFNRSFFFHTLLIRRSIMCKKLIFLISFVLVLVFASSLAQAAVQIWREAESADPLTAPMVISTGDPNASGGAYIGVPAGNNSTAASPAPAGTASFVFDVPAAGTYQVIVRLRCATDTIDDDSAYARIDGATLSSTAGLVGGWIKWNGISARVTGTGWAWVKVFNDGDGGADEKFTLNAGQYVLELAYREDGLYFDGILITDDLALDLATLPAALPACVETNILVNGGFESGFGAPWVFDNATPTNSIVDDTQEGANALKVTVAAKGSSDYIPALAQPGLSFAAGKKYTFSVFMKGEVDGMKVQLKPQQRGGSYTGYGQKTVTLTTEWAEYSTTTPVFSSAVATADVSIWLGMQAGTIYIDHARFYEGDYVAPCPPAVKPIVLKATKPNPGSGATNIPRETTLSWKKGEYATSHNVYFGTSSQAITDATVDNPMSVLVSMQQTAVTYAPVGIDYGTTYYWRIDEVNAVDNSITKGNIWNFTTKAIGLIIPQASITATASSSKDDTQGPINTINGSGLTGNVHSTDAKAMWLSATTTDPNKAWIQYNFDKVYKLPRMLIWNYNVTGLTSGISIKGVTIEYSADGGQTWKVLSSVAELPKGTGDPIIVNLGGVANGLAANAIRITANSNWSTTPKFNQYGLSEVKFYYIPVWPTTPNPANGATGIAVKPTLTWTAGDGVVEHRVFFGTDEQAVRNGTVASYTVATPSWATPELVLDNKYYWRVEEVNMASDPNKWSGDTWNFTVSPYRVVDDFEGASLKWTGGSSSSGNGAAASLDTTIANNGSKSMKFMYDDRSTQGYSQVSASPGSYTNPLPSGTNWKTGGPRYLVFWIYGDIANANTEKLYVVLNNSAVYWNPAAGKELVPVSEVLSPWWTQVTIPLVPSEVTLNNVTSIGIGFGRNGWTAGTGTIRIDDIRLYKNAPVPTVPANPGDANLVARYKMENNVNDSTSHAINGTILGNPQFVANTLPAYGKALVFDANQDCVDLGPSDPFNFTGSFTIAFWAKIGTWNSEWGNVMVATRGESPMGFQIRQGGAYVASMQGKTGKGLAFTTRGIGIAGISASWNEDMITDPPATGRWTHIACVFDKDAGVKRVYFDSKLIQASATTGGTLKASTTKASLGARSNSGNTGFEGFLDGSLDEVRLYNKALTDGEVKFLADPTP